MATQARTAGRRGNNRASLNEDFGQAFANALQLDFLRCGHHNGAHAVGNFAAFQNLGGNAHVLDAAVRARANNRLVDFHVGELGDGLGVFGQVGRCNRGRNGGKVDVDHALVFGVVVGGKHDGLVLRAALHVFDRLLVDGEDAIFRTGLNSHVRNAEAVVHGKRRNAFALEFHALVQGAVDANHADDVQNHVFARNPRVQLAREIEFNGGRHAEPGLARGDAGCAVGGTHARRERAQRAIGAGVAVGANDHVARSDDALLRKQRVLNAHAAHIEEVHNVVLACEIAALFALLGALDVFVRGEVVHNKGDLRAVEHLVHVGLLQLANSHRSGDVVGEREVDVRLDQLTGHYGIEPGVRRQNFLGHGHAHMESPLKMVDDNKEMNVEGQCVRPGDAWSVTPRKRARRPSTRGRESHPGPERCYMRFRAEMRPLMDAVMMS